MRKLAALALLAVVAACAPKIVPAPLVTTPKFPDFTAPPIPPALSADRAVSYQDRGWRFFQAGDLQNAEREFGIALKTSPAFYPAETSLGYLKLAQKDAKAALPHFDRTLEREGKDLSALLGRGQALLLLDRNADALTTLEAALAVDPTLADVQQRVAVLRFRGLGQDLERARQASSAGRLEEASAAYAGAIASSPDSPFLYRELADVERRQGDLDKALEHLRKAVSLDSSDASSLVQIGEILEARGDAAGAEKSYAAALAIEPSAAVSAKVEAIRARAELATLPAEYRAIGDATQVTRADLAALIGVRLGPMLQSASRADAVVITDVRGSWAANWIMAVTRAGVMEPFANHTFQPLGLVRRIDLARVVSRLLSRIAAGDRVRAQSWESARLKFSDLAPSHLEYPAASIAVAAEVLTLGPGDTFQPSKVVSGAEAVAAIDRVEMLAGPLATGLAKPGR